MSKQTLFRVICRTSSRTLAWFKSEARDHASEMTLSGLTEFAASYGGSKDYLPVAWIAAEEEESECMSIERALEVSTAAGRLIDCIDGKYVARGIEDPELVALQTRPQHVEASCEEEKKPLDIAGVLKNALLRSSKVVDKGHMEVKRPPLPGYGQRTPFDNFAGYAVYREDRQYLVPGQPAPFAGLQLDAPEQFRAPRSI